MDKANKMDKTKKKKIKRIIALVCIVAIVAVLAAMPLIASRDPETDGPKASILSGTVTYGSINTELIGGGTLAEDDGVTISVPSAVKLKEFLVSNGDAVTEGTAIATVDRVTVMTAISQVQETLEYLSEQIEKESDVDSEEAVTALAGGIVKILHAEEGESAQSVMLEHGSLAVLSLDGLMAVDMETESELSVGAAVTVTLSDGTEATGKVIKNLAGEMTVTVEDDSYPVGDAVKVTDADDAAVGSGELYIYSPWNATAYAGTVDSIEVGVGDTLSAGQTLMVLTDVGYSAIYRQLVGQRQEYEELMLQLFQMYQTETVTAPCDGTVSGVDKDSVQLLSTKGQGYTVSFLSNSPNGDDQTVYSNYLGKITAVASNGWVMNVNPQAIPIADYLDLSGVSLDETLMTQTVLHTQTDIPVFTLTEGSWTLVDRATVGSGDILLFAADDQGNLVWSVLLQKAAQQPEDPTEPTMPGAGTAPSIPSMPNETVIPTEPSAPAGTEQPTMPSVSGQPTMPTMPSGAEHPTGPAATDNATGPSMPDNQGGAEMPSAPSNHGAATMPSSGTGTNIPTAPGSATMPTAPAGTGSTELPGEIVDPGTGTAPNTSTTPTYPGVSGGSTTMPDFSGSGFGDMSGMGGMSGITEQEPVYELYGLDMSQIAAVTPQNTMTLDISIDELDITALKVGMTAQVRIDALGGEKYSATITEIGNTGTSNGGNSKYTVELTMDRAENMLSGMNATATIVLSTADNVLTIPSDALVENGNQTVVYTRYDEESETLLDPVAVTVGNSDGETVEILEGLASGQSYYYAYYDTLEVSFTPDFGGGGFMFG